MNQLYSHSMRGPEIPETSGTDQCQNVDLQVMHCLITVTNQFFLSVSRSLSSESKWCLIIKSDWLRLALLFPNGKNLICLSGIDYRITRK